MIVMARGGRGNIANLKGAGKKKKKKKKGGRKGGRMAAMGGSFSYSPRG